MRRKLPPLNAVRAFEAAARHVSFTRAAEELHVTHGAVSRQVALLEEWLGAALFDRAPSMLSLTRAGGEFLAELTPMLDRLAVAAEHVREEGHHGLRISAPPTFTMRWLIARMASFQKLRPDVEMRLTTSLAAVDFSARTYDIAIRGAHAPLTDCASVPFLTELIVPVCHVDLMAARSELPLDALAGMTLLEYATQPYSWREWKREAGVDPAPPHPSLQFEQMYFALQAALEGLGVVLVPLFLVIDDVLRGRLSVPFGLKAPMRRSYYANYALASPASLVAQKFSEWLIREGRSTEATMQEWMASMGWHAEAQAPPVTSSVTPVT